MNATTTKMDPVEEPPDDPGDLLLALTRKLLAAKIMNTGCRLDPAESRLALAVFRGAGGARQRVARARGTMPPTCRCGYEAFDRVDFEVHVGMMIGLGDTVACHREAS
jgi:hypothetical protein